VGEGNPEGIGEFPEPAQRQVITALRMAAAGEKAEIAKPMKGLESGIFEIALRHRGDAFRAVYAVQLDEDVWVLHAFQKKSKTGVRTPRAEIDLIRADQAPEGAAPMTEEELEIVRGSGNPFADVGLPDPDAELMKADLASEIVRVLRERKLTGARAAELAGVTEADISRIRKASLDRFTIDRLVKALNRLDIEVTVRTRARGSKTRRSRATHP
jgi:phage-related protein/predicted XRE-type DNA-binding protein